jgi:hypothetical protein
MFFEMLNTQVVLRLHPDRLVEVPDEALHLAVELNDEEAYHRQQARYQGQEKVGDFHVHETKY